MRHFVQGLRVDLKETVSLKQPKSFQEAEEMARLVSVVKTTMNNSNETIAAQLNLTKTLNTLTAGASSPLNTSQQQSLHVQMYTLKELHHGWRIFKKICQFFQVCHSQSA